MKRLQVVLFFTLVSAFVSCFSGNGNHNTVTVSEDSFEAKSPYYDSMIPTVLLDTPDAAKTDTNYHNKANDIDTKGVKPEAVISFAQTLIGTPYLYASTDPAKGFDCSGFITYVFNHFNINVPRSSIDFTDKGTEVPVAEALPGDLILFTGTDSTERNVGHMGLITTASADSLNFIHSTSGKMHGVTITPLNSYYKGRYIKTIRIFK